MKCQPSPLPNPWWGGGEVGGEKMAGISDYYTIGTIITKLNYQLKVTTNWNYVKLNFTIFAVVFSFSNILINMKLFAVLQVSVNSPASNLWNFASSLS